MGCPQFSDYYKETLATGFRRHKPNSWEKPLRGPRGREDSTQSEVGLSQRGPEDWGAQGYGRGWQERPHAPVRPTAK